MLSPLILKAVIIFALSIFIAAYAVDTEFEPKMDMGEMGISFEMPLGTPLENTLTATDSIEEDIRIFGKEEMKRIEDGLFDVIK